MALHEYTAAPFLKKAGIPIPYDGDHSVAEHFFILFFDSSAVFGTSSCWGESDLFGGGHLIVWFGFGFFCYIVVEDYLPVLHFYVLLRISMNFCSYKKKNNKKICTFLPFNQGKE